VQGQLGEKLVADLIREISANNSSGLLRLSRSKSIKAIFFESGVPVFAISNLTAEQLDNRLIKDGLASLEEIEQAKQKAGKASRPGRALVEMGVLTEEVLQEIVRDQVKGIIFSLFEWNQGDYLFDERIRATHDVTLDVSAADIILEGTRQIAIHHTLAQVIAPNESVVVRTKGNGMRLDSGKLMPMESYVLSRIEAPTAVSQVAALSGIAEEDAHRAVCALVAAGLLKKLEDGKEVEAEPESDETIDNVREEVTRKLHFYGSADYYEMLGVTRQATMGDIKRAYYQLAKKFHPDRYRQAEYNDLRGKLEALFALTTQAYETLSQPAQRAVYDRKIRESGQISKPANTFVTQKLPTNPIGPPPEEARSGDEPLAAQIDQAPSAPLPPLAAAVVTEARQSTNSQNPAQTAEQLYQQGRARYDRKEYHAAVHLLREAIKLDPSQPHYHFHLGIALIRNPRTRREAEIHLTKAGELDPYNAQIRVKVGLLYKEAGLAMKAEHYFKEALSLDPENRAALREIGKQSGKKKIEVGSLWKADLGTIAKRLFKKS
jgi:curved DNA-binding protein CbpA